MDAADITGMLEKGRTIKAGHGKSAAGMTLRDRYRRTMYFQHVDRLPNFEFGYWDETLTGWHAQGLPPEVKDESSAYAYFGIESWNSFGTHLGLLPDFGYSVVREDAEYLVYRDGNGCTAQINKQGHKSIPHFIDFGLKDRKTWEAYKERLQPSAERLTQDWPKLAAEYNRRDYPLSVWFGSLIGTPRDFIGFEGIALMVYDDPELLEEIVETHCVLICDYLSRVLPDVEFDFASGWEDICFNSGPIVGVNFMRDVVTPRYKRITDLLRKHGVGIIWSDCDGNILPIVDCFLAGGVNCMFPVEVHAGSDPVLLRQRWPDILMQGGFCKMRLAEGKAAIRREMERLQPLVRAGGFIPGVDHRVQADVKLENYKYYLKLKRELLGVGGTPHYDESKIG